MGRRRAGLVGAATAEVQECELTGAGSGRRWGVMALKMIFSVLLDDTCIITSFNFDEAKNWRLSNLEDLLVI